MDFQQPRMLPQAVLSYAATLKKTYSGMEDIGTAAGTTVVR
jgi:hypothetical protein